MPIADLSRTGFAFTSSRRETALGVETKFGKYTSMVGRYQLENGVNGTDSFAVIEKWASAEALKAHGASSHMATYAAKTKDMIASRAIHVLSPA